MSAPQGSRGEPVERPSRHPSAIRADPESRAGPSCHDDRMGPTGRVLVRALTWAVTPALVVATGLVQLAGPPDDEPLLAAADVPFVVATVACWLVGVLLTGKAFAHPAGWAFLGLGAALAWSGFTDEYSVLAHSSGSNAPAGDLVATL